AGKTTLATMLEQKLIRERVLPCVIDGDSLRAGLSAGLGFTAAERKENVRRAGEAALLVAEAGAVAGVALVSPFPGDRALVARRARTGGIPFAEIYVNAPLSECERRDPKSLYKRARAGEVPSFTGVDSPYEEPLDPDLELLTDRETAEESAEKLFQFS